MKCVLSSRIVFTLQIILLYSFKIRKWRWERRTKKQNTFNPVGSVRSSFRVIESQEKCKCLLYHEKPTVAYSSYARIDLRRYKARTTFVGEPLIGEVGQLNVNWRYIRYMHEHLRILNQSSLFIVKTRNWWNINQWLITL